MFQKIKNKISESRTAKLSKFNAILLLIAVVLNAMILGLSIWLYSYRANLEFMRANVLQLLIISIVSLSLFYTSYKQFTKKKPSIGLIAFYLLAMIIIIANGSGFIFLIEQMIGRASFGINTSLVILVSFIFFGLLVSRYDFQLIDSKERMYNAIREHFTKNIGIFLFLMFVSAWVGLVTGAFSVIVLFGYIFINLYLLKTLLSNLRK